MFNPETLLQRRIDRIKFYITTDKLGHFQKRIFIMAELSNILLVYYGKTSLVIFYFIHYQLRQEYIKLSTRISIFYYTKILRLNEDEVDARILGLTVEEVIRQRNVQDD